MRLFIHKLSPHFYSQTYFILLSKRSILKLASFFMFHTID